MKRLLIALLLAPVLATATGCGSSDRSAQRESDARGTTRPATHELSPTTVRPKSATTQTAPPVGPLPSLLTASSGKKFEVKPAVVDYTGDGSAYLGGAQSTPRSRSSDRFTWTTWTPTGATGTGFVWLDDCKPDCADGTFHPYRATAQASSPSNGHFKELVITYQYEGRAVTDRRAIRYVEGDQYSGSYYEWTIPQ